MDKEEKEAVRVLMDMNCNKKVGEEFNVNEKVYIGIAINLITQLQKENETTCKLNANMSKRHLNDTFKIKNYEKQIDLMAEEIRKTILIVKPESKFCQYEEDCKNIRCKDCIKQFFGKQAKEI